MTKILYCASLYLVVLLHAGFMVAEVFGSPPFLLRVVLKKRRPPVEVFQTEQRKLVFSIVRNAGVYNGIVAASVAWAIHAGATDMLRVLLGGAVVAGVFGAFTISSLTIVQAIIAVIAIIIG